MRAFRIKCLLLLAVLCAGLHVPAMAHGDHPDPYQALEVVGAVEAHDRDVTRHEESTGGLHELFHHHHCPMGMTVDDDVGTGVLLSARSTPRPGETAVLLSRATAPPIEPPLA